MLGDGVDTLSLWLRLSADEREREREEQKPIARNDFWQHGQKLLEKGELFLFSFLLFFMTNLAIFRSR